jgi:hypothetical protein
MLPQVLGGMFCQILGEFAGDTGANPFGQHGAQFPKAALGRDQNDLIVFVRRTGLVQCFSKADRKFVLLKFVIIVMRFDRVTGAAGGRTKRPPGLVALEAADKSGTLVRTKAVPAAFKPKKVARALSAITNQMRFFLPGMCPL